MTVEKSFLKKLGRWTQVVAGVLLCCLYAHKLRILPLTAQSSEPLPSPPAPICEAMGHHESISLPDGSSQLELNSGACITMEFHGTTRIVRLLSGEAIFQVIPDPRRPFRVETGPISIVDIGTKFDVYRTELSTRVSVSEGAVQIPSGDANVQPLRALQQVDIPDDTVQHRVRRPITLGDFDRMTAWVHGDIELEQQTLREAMTEFARYQPIHFDFADPAIAEVKVSGVFPVTGVESFLRTLKPTCIHGDYDKVTQQIKFTSTAGKQIICQ